MTYYIHAGLPACSSQFALALEFPLCFDWLYATIVPQVRAWLARRYADIDEHLREDAITDTCLRLRDHPLPFVEGSRPLAVYLGSQAGGHLSNLRRQRRRRADQNLRTEEFENFPEFFVRYGGGSLRDDYISIEGLPAFVLQRIRECLGADDRRRLDLYLHGSPADWTVELGIGHLSPSKRLARIRDVKESVRKKLRRLARTLFPAFFKGA